MVNIRPFLYLSIFFCCCVHAEVLRLSLVPEKIQKINPLAGNLSENAILNTIYDCLFLRRADQGLRKLLVEDYEIKNRNLILRIKKGVNFHDGKELTSKDVVFSLKRYSGSKNAEYRKFYATMESIQITGKLELQMRFKERISHEVINNLSIPVFSKEKCRGAHCGTGPYLLHEGSFKKNWFSLFANKDYFRGRPAIEELRFIPLKDFSVSLTKFLKNEIDFFPVTEEEYRHLKESPNLLFRVDPSYRFLCLDFNPGASEFTDETIVLFRSIVKNDDYLKKFNSILFRNVDSFVTERNSYHVSCEREGRISKKALDALRKRAFTLSYLDGVPIFKRLASFIQFRMYQYGVRIELIRRSFEGGKTLFSKKKVPYDLVMSIHSDSPDPSFIYNVWHSSQKRAFGFKSFPEEKRDKLLEKLLRVATENEKKELMIKVQKAFYKFPPALFLVELNRGYAYRKSLKNVKFSHSSNFLSEIYTWRFD